MTGPILGLCSFTHDSAAALVLDGQLVGFVEEERLSGIKHDKHFPALAVEWLLEQADISRARVRVS
jgi:carbamoyltransferase